MTTSFKIYVIAKDDRPPQVCVDINSAHITFDDEGTYTNEDWMKLCEIVLNEFSDNPSQEEWRVSGGGNSSCDLTYKGRFLTYSSEISGLGGDSTITVTRFLSSQDSQEFVKFQQQLVEHKKLWE